MNAETLERLFRQHDPMGLIAIGAPEDEYYFECLEILRHLPAMYGAEQVRSLIWGIMAASFSGCPDQVGPEERYQDLADAVWGAYTSPSDRLGGERRSHMTKPTPPMCSGCGRPKVACICKGNKGKGK